MVTLPSLDRGHSHCSRKLTGLHVPKLDGGVNAACQQEAIVAREDESVDIELVTFDREKFVSGLYVPHECLDVHVSVLLWIESDVTSGDQFPVVAEGD